MSSFAKHQRCGYVCQDTDNGGECIARCQWLEVSQEETRPIFEERDTDQESRLDRKARARECK